MQEQTPPIRRADFAASLKAAIKSARLTYSAAAELVNQELPADVQVSAMSMWHYAAGKSVPRRFSVYQRICALFLPGLSERLLDLAESGEWSDADQPPPSPEELHGGKAVAATVTDHGDGVALLELDATTEWETAMQVVRSLSDAGVLTPELADATAP